jgi:soluble P-type ATPase
MEALKGRKVQSILCHVGQNVDGNVRNHIAIGNGVNDVPAAQLTSLGVLMLGRKSTILILYSNIQSIAFLYEEEKSNVGDGFGKKNR